MRVIGLSSNYCVSGTHYVLCAEYYNAEIHAKYINFDNTKNSTYAIHSDVWIVFQWAYSICHVKESKCIQTTDTNMINNHYSHYETISYTTHTHTRIYSTLIKVIYSMKRYYTQLKDRQIFTYVHQWTIIIMIIYSMVGYGFDSKGPSCIIHLQTVVQLSYVSLRVVLSWCISSSYSLLIKETTKGLLMIW